MNLLTTSLLIIVFYGIYLYLKKIQNYFKYLGVPYIPSLPIFGNLAPVIFRRKHFNDVLNDIYNYYPNAKYVGIFNFIKPIIILRDPELIKNITIKDFEYFPSHRVYNNQTTDQLVSLNLFNLSGNKWRETRALLSPAFTVSKMKNMYNFTVPCIENLTNYIIENSKNSNNIFNSKELFTMYANDVIATCIFGITVNTFKDPENKFYKLGQEATDFNGLKFCKYIICTSFPKIKKMLRLRMISDRVTKFFTETVRTTVAKRDEMGIERPDMLQLMMKARGNDTNHHKIETMFMTANAFAFFFAGFETISSQMCTIAQELTINPSIQTRVQNEIDAVVQKTDGKPTYDNILAMPYFDAVINEAIRKHNVSNTLERVCCKPYELPPALPNAKPFVVPVGMSIWIPMSGIHNDEKYYENPRKFDPERYLDKKVTTNQPENLGFGIGPRSCIGKRFAKMEIKVLFFYLLSKFTFKINHKTCLNFEYDTNYKSVVPKGGYWLTFEPRNCS